MFPLNFSLTTIITFFGSKCYFIHSFVIKRHLFRNLSGFRLRSLIIYIYNKTFTQKGKKLQQLEGILQIVTNGKTKKQFKLTY